MNLWFLVVFGSHPVFQGRCTFSCSTLAENIIICQLQKVSCEVSRHHPPTQNDHCFNHGLDVNHHSMVAWWHGSHGSLAKSAHCRIGRWVRRVNLRIHISSHGELMRLRQTIPLVCKKGGSLTVVWIKTQFHWSFFFTNVVVFKLIFSTTFKV